MDGRMFTSNYQGSPRMTQGSFYTVTITVKVPSNKIIAVTKNA